jgi:hypothetical protein
MKLRAHLVIVVLALLLAPAALPVGLAATQPQPAQQNGAAAQGVTHLGGAQGWDAYANADKAHKVCYLIGKPSKSEPAGAKRSEIYASVTHRAGENVANEVSFNVGYLFKEGSQAELQIGDRKFALFTNKEGAWGRDAATDKAIVDALAKGKQATLKGTSARGTATNDTYTLAGFAQALGQIDKACGVKR